MNDYSYYDDPAKTHDSRWVHRPRADWERYELRKNASTIEGRVYQGLQVLIRLRKTHPAFADGRLEIIPTGNEHVLGYVRLYEGQKVVVFANFSESVQILEAPFLERYGLDKRACLHGQGCLTPTGDLVLVPFDMQVWE